MNKFFSNDETFPDEAIKAVVRQTCIELGVISDTIDSQEIVKRHKRAFLEKIKRDPAVRWTKMGGRSSTLLFNRSDYEDFKRKIGLI